MLSKLLSNVLLINSSEFATQTPEVQTKLLGEAKKPVRFVADFNSLMNTGNLRAKLLAGEDVSVELEFNDIGLTEAEKATLAAVQPILERLAPKYPWLPEQTFDRIRFSDKNTMVTRNGYDLSKARAAAIFKVASKFWADPTAKVPASAMLSNVDGYRSKRRSINREGIEIGCQSISRAEVEYIARTMGLTPNV